MTSRTDEMIAYLEALLSTPSAMPEGNTSAVADVIAAYLRGFGYEPQVVGPTGGATNVVASIGEGQPEIVLCTHIDTVGPGTLAHWSVEPFAATVKDGRIYGLGAENCKGAAAIFLAVAKALAEVGGPNRGKVVFAFVGDEENLGDGGARYLREHGLIKPSLFVVGGPSGFDLGCEERGVLWLSIKTTGHAFHAGSPSRGDNAVLRATRLIATLEERLQPELATRRDTYFESTMAISRIHGGHDINTVPDSCSFEIDRRVLPGEPVDVAIAEIEAVLRASGEPADKWSMEVLVASNGFMPGRDGPGVRAHQSAVEEITGKQAKFLLSEGASDGRHFADDGIEILNFGAGFGDRCHSPDEYIDIDQLELGFAIQMRALSKLTDGFARGEPA